MRLIFELYSTRQYTVRSLIAELWRRGVKYTEKTPRFGHSKLHQILKDRAIWARSYYREEWHPGTHEPLVDRATFDRVQRLLGNKVYLNHETTYGHKLITCRHCGLFIVGEPKRKTLADGTEREYSYYRCTAVSSKGHPRVRLTERDLDAQVLAVFESLRVDDPEVLGWFRDTLRDLAGDREAQHRHQRRTLEGQLARLDKKKSDLVRLRLDGRIDDEQYDQLQQELRAEGRVALDRLEELAHQGSEDADLVVATFELSQALAQRWDAADVAARRQLLQILASNWLLEGRTLVPDLRKPFDILSNGLLTAEVGNGRGEKI